ncbi:MAG TPA: SulP family inorganic anion transporter [Verrucomicrobiota bacterium]|nr:SulP family inorganic anion transporter [Verrucomicrobiota bacterium]HNT15366.1 SulP family inorganic anion transporter [Verrucomicrobiota bacterium]
MLLRRRNLNFSFVETTPATPRFHFQPRLWSSLKGYSRATLVADLTSGLIVGIVALPLAMALAIASGLKPEVGIFTSIVGGFLISCFGGSRVQVGGPAGAFVPLLVPIVAVHGPEGLAACALIAGVILVVLGFARLGSMIRFVPYPVVVGFTSGIAIIILSTQLQDFFGLPKGLPADFLGKLKAVAADFQPNWATTGMALAGTLLIWYWPASWARRVPGSMAVIVLGAVGVAVFQLHERWGIATLGSQFGAMPRGLPWPHAPLLSLETWRDLLPSGMTVAALGAIESLLCAVVADGMIDDRHDSNQELVGQGIANIACAFFGGMPATGVIARTATNVRSGAKTPVAGLVHAAVLLLILLVAAPLASFIPLAALSAVLVVVAIRMGEWHHFTRLRRWPREDTAVLLTAFVLTVVTDLPVAVGASLVLASVLLVRQLSRTTDIRTQTPAPRSGAGGTAPTSEALPAGVLVFRVLGAIFFGAADKLETALRRTGSLPEVLILQMEDALVLDASGLNALEDLQEKLARRGKHLILCGPHSQPLFALTRAGFLERIGLDNVAGDLESALARGRQLMDKAKTEKIPG